ncbi:hypothetical protein like AT3G48800 [Hibiscus trionum]|uniref:SAM domain-containing protein n=1 Tax=Hibiscus trionum TaxID=183268 RepID=A0A9W7GXG8_HIBTR|nr:hypothetical protein like AT3G48800 [Hibiscus trionum]
MADIQPSDGQADGGEGSVPVASSDTVGSKRQRRPSVRLGDIGGDQPHDSHTRRQSSSAAASVPKQWKHPSHHHSLNPSDAAASGKSSKTRAMTNLTTEFNAKNQTLNGAGDANNNNTNNLDGVAIGSWRVKNSKKRGPAAKRVRSNWVSNSNVETEEKLSGGEDTDDFDRENSESPLREQSHHLHFLDNLGINGKERRDFYHGNNQRMCEEDGVRTWLESLGLGRYAPVFEIHEVDEEILPLLTLEDLKDMGINAVGSRRKLFSAIQRLGKGFS